MVLNHVRPFVYVYYMFLHFLIGYMTLNTSVFSCLIFLICKNGCEQSYLIRLL